MGPIKTRISSVKFFRKNNNIAKVCLGYQGNPFYVLEISGTRKGNPDSMTGVRAIGKKLFVLYRADSKILDTKFFIFRKNIVRCRHKKGFGMQYE